MTKPNAQQLGTCVFGGLTFLFLVAIFWIDPPLSPTRATALRLLGAVFAGLFGYFMTGNVKVVSEGRVFGFGRIVVQAGSGAALFVLVFFFLSSKLEHSKEELKEPLERIEDNTGAIAHDTSTLVSMTKDTSSSRNVMQDVARLNKTYSVVVTQWVEEDMDVSGRRRKTVRHPVIELVHSATEPVVYPFDAERKQYNVKVTQYVIDKRVDSEGRNVIVTKLVSRMIESDLQPSIKMSRVVDNASTAEKAPTESRGITCDQSSNCKSGAAKQPPN